MDKFGSDYPPGCHSLPWDDEEEDERCAIARWVNHWLGTEWRFKQHYIWRGQSRNKSGWTYTLTLFWVCSLYLYWHDRKSFNLRLSLLKAGQRCQPDEQEAQLVLQVNATSDLTLDRYLDFTLSASLPRTKEQADHDGDFFAPPMKPLWQHRHIFEQWQGHGQDPQVVYLIERRDKVGNTLNNVDLCSTLTLVETAIDLYLRDELEESDDVGDWHFSIVEWTVDDFSVTCARVAERRDRHNVRIEQT